MILPPIMTICFFKYVPEYFEKVVYKCKIPSCKLKCESKGKFSKRFKRGGKPGVLQSMGLQRVRHNLMTEQTEGKACQMQMNLAVQKRVYYN